MPLEARVMPLLLHEARRKDARRRREDELRADATFDADVAATDISPMPVISMPI